MPEINKKIKIMEHIKTFESFLNEAAGAITPNQFPKFQAFIESLVPKSKRRIALFVEDHRLLIGYYPTGGTMGDLSKSLPESANDEIDEIFVGSKFTFMTRFEKPDPRTGKKMTFSAVSAKTQNDLLKIEDLF
jgi:hypothetical protein